MLFWIGVTLTSVGFIMLAIIVTGAIFAVLEGVEEDD